MKVFKLAYNLIEKDKGSTLTELLIVIAVMGIALLPASQSLLTGFETYVIENENMERVYDGHTALEMITEKIRFNGNEASKTIDIVDKSVDGLLRNSLQINDEYIYRDGQEIIISDNKGSKQVILENVDAFEFDLLEYITKDNKQLLSQFEITVEINRRESRKQVFNTTIYLRNR